MTTPVPGTLELDVTGFAHGGTGVARHDGRVVFVSGAIPGERVRARLDERAATDSRFWRADVTAVVEASPHRREHVWPEAALERDPAHRAGGADLGHIELSHQRALKRQVLQEALDRFGGGEVPAPEVEGIGDPDGLSWRTRMTVHVDDRGRVGPFAARSHQVIEVRAYPLARPALDSAARALRGAQPGRVDLIEPADGEVRTIARPVAGRRQHRSEKAPIVERVAGREFTLDVGGFWQAHPDAASTLHTVVDGFLADRVDPGATHFDLYGGVGLFSATLAGRGARDIVTVESDRRATHHASRNLADIGVQAVTDRVDRYLAGEASKVDTGVVILDPPRAGAGRAVVESLDALDPAALVYVACDPVALARDIGTFRGSGGRSRSFAHSTSFLIRTTSRLSPCCTDDGIAGSLGWGNEHRRFHRRS